MNSISSSDLTISTSLMENESSSNQLCNNNLLPLYILVASFLLTSLCFIIYIVL